MGTHNVQCWRTPRCRNIVCSCLRTSQFLSSRRKTLLLFSHWSRDLSDTTKGEELLLCGTFIAWLIQTCFSAKRSPFVSQSVGTCKWYPRPKSWIYMYIQMRHHTSDSEIRELNVNDRFEQLEWMKMWNNDKATDQVVTVAGHWFRLGLNSHWFWIKWPYHINK